MKPSQIEFWALKVIEQVEAGQPNEDSRVELKSEWIDPKKAARLIAGHANAARGEPILWLIGVDEKKGVIGADNAELANWYPQVQKRFDGLAPDLIDINVPIGDKTIVALLFETDRAPFVYKNPDAGEITQEVPWREARRTRSANRSDLIKLLVPLQQLPNFEVLGGELIVKSVKEFTHTWKLTMTLYVESEFGNQIVIPFHKCQAKLKILEQFKTDFDYVYLEPNGVYDTHEEEIFGSIKKTYKIFNSLSLTIKKTDSEVIINGSGMIYMRDQASTERVSLGNDLLNSDLEMNFTLTPIFSNQSLSINVKMIPSKNLTDNDINLYENNNVTARWILNKSL